jgi:hypothetical protein
MRPGALPVAALAGLLLFACSETGGSAGSSPSTAAPPRSPATVHAVADASCRQETTSRSLNSDTATSFTIGNQTSDQLSVYWLDFQGKRVKYFDLPAGQTHLQGTFVTHPWVVADATGNCQRLFTVTTPANVQIG